MTVKSRINTDVGGRLVTAGSIGSLCSLILPYATFNPGASVVIPGPGNTLGINWTYGRVFLLLLAIGIVTMYISRRPRVRAIVAAVVGSYGTLVPLLVFQLGAGQSDSTVIHRAGGGAYVAQVTSAIIIAGALYWWVRPDHSFPNRNTRNPSQDAEHK